MIETHVCAPDCPACERNRKEKHSLEADNLLKEILDFFADNYEEGTEGVELDELLVRARKLVLS